MASSGSRSQRKPSASPSPGRLGSRRASVMAARATAAAMAARRRSQAPSRASRSPRRAVPGPAGPSAPAARSTLQRDLQLAMRPPTAAGSAAASSPPEGFAAEDAEAGMLMQRIMYNLMQKPIVPDKLVFLFSACYLVIVLGSLGIGAVYFTYRLKPPAPPVPPQEVDTTILLTDPPTTTQIIKKITYPKRSQQHPIICIFALPGVNSQMFFDHLKNKCNFFVLKNVYAESAGTPTLDGQATTGSQLQSRLRTAFSRQQVSSLLLTIVCCDALNFIGTGVIDSFYVKLLKNENMTAAAGYLNGLLKTYNNILVEVEDTDLANIDEKIWPKGKFMVIRSSELPVMQDSLAQLRKATLVNSLTALLNRTKFAAQTVPALRSMLCSTFTLGALVANSTASTIKPGDTVDSVTSVNTDQVCKNPGFKEESSAVSLYRDGSTSVQFASYDSAKTMAHKVEKVLLSNFTTCLVAYDVQYDDCPNYTLLDAMEAVFDKGVP